MARGKAINNLIPIVKEVSDNLGIPYKVCLRAYISYWMYLKETIGALPLRSGMSKEEFDKLNTSFNIPSIGKLHSSYERMKIINDRYLMKLKQEKENGNR